MNIKPVTGPGVIPPNGTPEHVRSAKAVAAFNKGQSSYDKAPQQSPVQNQNAISAEEMGAIIPQPNIQATEETDNIPVIEATEPVQEVKKVDPLRQQYDLLARREKALRAKVQQQEQAMRSREDAFRAKEAELQAKSNIDPKKYVSVDRFKQDPLGVMQETGLSYDELTTQIINQQPLDPRVNSTINRMEAKIAQLEKQLEDSGKNYQENQKQAYDSAVNQIRSDVKALVKSDPSFEVIRATNSVNDVVELIERVYKEEGTLLSVEEATQQVEDYLTEEASRLSRVDKIQKRLNASAKQRVNPTQSPVAKVQQPQQMKTLTNAAGSSRPLSARERALLAFKGELK
jgi:hypothetical protein